MTTVAIPTNARPTAYSRGEIVGVAIEWATVLQETNAGLMVRTRCGFVFNVPIGCGKDDAGKREVTIVRQVPCEGTPRLGDVWADRDGVQYYATAGYGQQIQLRDREDVSADWLKVHRERGPLRLVFRAGSTSAGVQ